MCLLVIGNKIVRVAAVGPGSITRSMHVKLTTRDCVRTVLAGVLRGIARPRREALVLFKQLHTYIFREPHGTPFSALAVPEVIAIIRAQACQAKIQARRPCDFLAKNSALFS